MSETTNSPLPNFQWHIPNLLATGMTPRCEEDIDWLMNIGISCVVSFVPMSHKCFTRMTKLRRDSRGLLCHIGSYRDHEEFLPNNLEQVAKNIFYLQPVYIHCGNGVKYSPKFAQQCIESAPLPLLRWLDKRANDLNYGDLDDWARGHYAYHGSRIDRAITVIENALNSTNEEAIIVASSVLVNLFKHIPDKCFGISAEHRICQLEPIARIWLTL